MYGSCKIVERPSAQGTFVSAMDVNWNVPS